MPPAPPATFSSTVTDFWSAPLRSGTVVSRSPALTVVSDATVPENRRVTLLETDDTALAVISPAIAERIDVSTQGVASVAAFRETLADAEVLMHGRDRIFYFSESAAVELMAEQTPTTIRVIDQSDRHAFETFESSASAQDRDDAWVELDHWAVVAGFVGETIVCAASAYPWGDSRLADLGVLTLSEDRGAGHARSVVRALACVAFGRGFEPQYRCQLDNTASLALARSLGLSRFGDWDVVSPDSPY